VKGVSGVERWEPARIQHEEPALSPAILAAAYAPTTGVVNSYEACFALAENAVRNGLNLLTGSPVQRLQQNGDGWEVLTPSAHLTSRFVINAAGLYADHIAALAGIRTFTIHPRKGEEYLLDRRLHGLVKHVIFPCPSPVSKGILIIPTCDGALMIGPTAEDTPDRGDLRTSDAGAQAVFKAVGELAPGISEKDIIAQFAGLRAAATGEDFIIGPTSRRGFINAAGIQSPGLTAAPAIAHLLVNILRDEGLELTPRDEFVANLPPPVHFAALSTQEQMALTLRDPRYRRIVCRCEYVTEGEVLDAIAHGATTLDGIKLRTRAGMGRCQGGFCAIRCMELLAKAHGRAMSDVTKRGPGSWLVRAARKDEP
jgi:glycerol-3-phosphate dehydrogenase